jgi:GTPase
VYLVGWTPSRRPGFPSSAGSSAGEDSLHELAELSRSAGADVVGTALQRSPRADPATLIGRGKLEEVKALAHARGVQCVIFDHDLSPTQMRNLEQAFDLKILDRTQLILDIFARRARTREGQLQVELAQLNYLLPRLAGQGPLLSRLGGGIGTRGPGEQQLEFDRRRVRARIGKLKDAIERVRSQRALHREHRREQRWSTVALVGYANAGKSTLFNALTNAHVESSARMFATLDPTVRALKLDRHRQVLLSDTVGFIRRLPTHLVASFRATLEELEDAALLLHVTDASDPQHQAQHAAVESLLADLGVASTPRLRVWNKIDLLQAVERERLSSGRSDIAVSACTGEGLDLLRQRIGEAIPDASTAEARSVATRSLEGGAPEPCQDG